MHQVEFKFAREQRVRIIDGMHAGKTGEIQVACSGWSGNWYHVLVPEGTRESLVTLCYEHNLESIEPTR